MKKAGLHKVIKSKALNPKSEKNIKFQAPNPMEFSKPKTQIPNKSQLPKIKSQGLTPVVLVIGNSDL
jgi:hypothetical protein